MHLSRPRDLFVATLAAVLAGVVAPAAEGADRPLSHSVMFTLKDRSPASREKFVASCEKYLTGHRGTVSFTVGTIAEDVTEAVSDREFDVALHVVFEDKAMLAEYLKNERHTQFVEENKAKFAKVRVFDTYLPVPQARRGESVKGSIGLAKNRSSGHPPAVRALARPAAKPNSQQPGGACDVADPVRGSRPPSEGAWLQRHDGRGDIGGGLSHRLASPPRADQPDIVYELAVWLLTGGFIGARALFLLAYPEVVHSFWDIFKVWQGGIVFYGCIMGGLVGTLLYYARHPFPFGPMADAVAPALGIGVALGRVGCLLNGCCFGGVSAVPWAITFPSATLPWLHHVTSGFIPVWAPRSLPVHPAQVYAALDGLFLVGLLTAYYPRRRRDGEVMALLMVTYPVSRFLIEGLRDDDGSFLLGMTLSQCISAVLFPCGLLTWYILSRRPLGHLYVNRPQGAAIPRPGPLAADVPANPARSSSTLFSAPTREARARLPR